MAYYEFQVLSMIQRPKRDKNANKIRMKSHINFTFENAEATNRTSVVSSEDKILKRKETKAPQNGI